MATPGSRDRQNAEATEREDRAARAQGGDGLIGDTAENRNLSGSSTWETLPDQQGERSSGGGATRDHKQESRDDPGRPGGDDGGSASSGGSGRAKR